MGGHHEVDGASAAGRHREPAAGTRAGDAPTPLGPHRTPRPDHRQTAVVTMLQRRAGNRAVQRLLSDREPAPEPPVQRDDTVLTERQKVEKAHRSEDPSDIKEIKDWNQADETEKIDLASALAFNYRLFFGPNDRSTMRAIWTSFGDNLPGVVNRHFPTWEKCVEVYSALKELKPVTDAKDAFKADIKKAALDNLDANIVYLAKEKSSLEPLAGPGADFLRTIPMVKKAQADRIARVEAMKKMAGELVKLRAEQRRMLTIEVGFEWTHGFGDNMDRKTFNPLRKPSQSNAKGPTWDDVNAQWALAAGEIADKANRYPWLYGLLKDDAAGEKQLDNISAFKDPEKAGAEMVATIVTLINRAEAVRKKVGGAVDWYDLVPIRLALFEGKKWGDRTGLGAFNNWAALDAVGKRQNDEWWTEFGLQAAAEVGLLAVTLATAGAAPLVVGLIGAAVAVGAPAAAAVSEAGQADKLATLNKATVLPGTDLVAQAQVDEQRAASVAHTIQAVVNAFLAGAPLAKDLSLTVRLLGLNELAAAEQAALVKEAIGAMGARRVADTTGRTFPQMLALVGEATEAGQVVRRESTALVHKSLDELTDADLRVLGFPAGKTGYFSKGAGVANVSREQALKDLLHEAEKAGISIDASEDAAAYLDFRARQMDMPPQDVHAVTMGDAILVRPEHAENVRILREELIHAFQQRAGMASNEVVEGEIQARLLMIRYRHTWAITNDEVREMIREVRIMRRTGKY